MPKGIEKSLPVASLVAQVKVCHGAFADAHHGVLGMLLNGDDAQIKDATLCAGFGEPLFDDDVFLGECVDQRGDVVWMCIPTKS
jgi:hypothetical protein